MTQDPITINVKNIINSPYAIDSEDGQKVYELLYKSLKNNKHVILSFKDINLLITAFLNTAIGQLYKDFSSAEVELYLSKSDFNPHFETTWNKVVEGAQTYYAHSDKINKNINEILED